MFKTVLHRTQKKRKPGNHTSKARLTRRLLLALVFKSAPAGSRDLSLRWCALVFLSVVTASVPALAQQKTGPGISGDDSLTWHGITLYGVVDVGLQYDTHSAPFTPYRPSASGNIVRQNSRESVTGLTPSNMGQSRVGLQGIEPLNDDWSAIFQLESFSTRNQAKSPIL